MLNILLPLTTHRSKNPKWHLEYSSRCHHSLTSLEFQLCLSIITQNGQGLTWINLLRFRQVIWKWFVWFKQRLFKTAPKIYRKRKLGFSLLWQGGCIKSLAFDPLQFPLLMVGMSQLAFRDGSSEAMGMGSLSLLSAPCPPKQRGWCPHYEWLIPTGLQVQNERHRKAWSLGHVQLPKRLFS